MTMQISKIVLYNAKGETRVLSFRTGAVNVITGASKSGKSALIHIVEYCLGRDELTVPAGIIRDSVVWYGLLLELPETQVFVARQAPRVGQKASANVYFQAGRIVALPSLDDLRQTVTPEGLNQSLTRLVGISPNLHEPEEGETRRPLEATLRHALFMNFQAQDEIASPRFLFHRQGEQWIPQAIRDTLPYFLGAVDEERLARVQELRRLRSDIRRLQREVEEHAALQGVVSDRAAALVAEAQQVGLLERAYRPELPTVFGRLSAVVASSTRGAPSQFPGRETVLQLEADRTELNREVRRLIDELESVRTFQGEQGGFEHEVHEQQARLQSLHYFPNSEADSSQCPVCLSRLEVPVPNADALTRSLGQLSAKLEGVIGERPRVLEYRERIETRLADARRRLAANREALEGVRAQDARLQQTGDTETARAHVAGRISLYLETVAPVNDSDTLREDLDQLKARAQQLDEELQEDSEKELLISILNILGGRITEWARGLQLEHSQFPLRLDLGKLSVVADTDKGPVPMDRMGSGENWVGYHLIAHLALHEWFAMKERPVPSFIILDQPTQVYYPADRDAEGSTDVLEDEDRDAVTRMFRLIFDVVQRLHPSLQVIIMDHADLRDDWFQEAVVERWRGGEKLIPASWSAD